MLYIRCNNGEQRKERANEAYLIFSNICHCHENEGRIVVWESHLSIWFTTVVAYEMKRKEGILCVEEYEVYSKNSIILSFNCIIKKNDFEMLFLRCYET